MTKTETEYVKILKDKMPKFTGTKVEIEKKIAMFIYLELGKTKVFDEKYFFADSKEKKKMERAAKHTRNNVDSIIKKRKLVCITASNLYKKLLHDFGIEAHTRKLTKGDEHLSTVIFFSNGEKIVADVQRDFDKIQTNRKTTEWGAKYAFGRITDFQISEDELFELQKACGYVNSKDDYMDNAIARLKQKVKGLPPNEILRELINDSDVNNYSSNIGYIELYKYFSSLIYDISPVYHRNGIDYFNCYITKELENGETEREYCMCIYSYFNNEVEAYLYSNTDKKFKITDLDTLEKLENQGFHLGRIPQEKGLKVLRKCLDKNKAEKIKSKYQNNFNKNLKIFDGLDFGDLSK